MKLPAADLAIFDIDANHGGPTGLRHAWGPQHVVRCRQDLHVSKPTANEGHLSTTCPVPYNQNVQEHNVPVCVAGTMKPCDLRNGKSDASHLQPLPEIVFA